MTRFATPVLALVVVAALTSCAPSVVEPAPTEPPTASDSVTPTPVAPTPTVPESCDLPTMVSTITDLGFPGAVDVTPPWTPAAGTTLRLATDAGGRACAWGPPNTDAGVVVWWTIVDDSLWTEAVSLAATEGAESVDIPGLDEDAAVLAYSPMDETHEFPFWSAEVRVGSLWIHVASSSFVDVSDGNAVIEQALVEAGVTP